MYKRQTYDSATVTAVKSFQKNNNTGVDGVAGAATLRILYERDPVRADEAPKPVPTVAPGVGEMQGPDPSSVELAHWFDDVKQNYKNGQKLTVWYEEREIPDGTEVQFYQRNLSSVAYIQNNCVDIPDQMLTYPDEMIAYVYVRSQTSGCLLYTSGVRRI